MTRESRLESWNPMTCFMTSHDLIHQTWWIVHPLRHGRKNRNSGRSPAVTAAPALAAGALGDRGRGSGGFCSLLNFRLLHRALLCRSSAQNNNIFFATIHFWGKTWKTTNGATESQFNLTSGRTNTHLFDLHRFNHSNLSSLYAVHACVG